MIITTLHPNYKYNILSTMQFFAMIVNYDEVNIV